MPFDGVTIALLKAETGRRGFSIMPDEQQLGSIQAGIAAHEKALLRLRSLVADAGQRRRLDALDPQCAGLIAYMKIGVELAGEACGRGHDDRVHEPVSPPGRLLPSHQLERPAGPRRGATLCRGAGHHS